MLRLGFSRVARPVGARALRAGAPRLDVIPFNLADIGEGIAEVEVLEVHVSTGDAIEAFAPVMEVQSDKATVEITSRYEGTVTAVHYAVGDIAKVGTPLIDIDVEGMTAEAPAAETPAAPEPAPVAAAEPAPAPAPVAAAPEPEPAAPHRPPGGANLTLATPAVRRIARENDVDLALVAGTGKKGRVLKGDVLAYVASGGTASALPAAAPAPGAAVATAGLTAADEVVPIAGIQRLMMQSMTRSLEVPHFGYNDEFCVDALIHLREQLKPLAEERGARLTFMPLLIKAASLALKEFPVLNAVINEDGASMTHLGSHNIGVAMDTPRGLLVPCVKDAQARSVLEIAEELGRLQELGAANKLGEAELTGTTFTLSNIGAIGGTYMGPVISPPQVAIGALGKFVTAPAFDAAGNVVPSTKMNISWSGDHRVIDGATMARFSNRMKQFIEEPLAFVAAMK